MTERHSSGSVTSRRPGTRAQSPAGSKRPKVLLITDRVPGADSGYGLRVSNVISGLRQVGDLHVCLIDSSTGGVSMPENEGYESTVIRASNPRYWRKLLLALCAIVSLPYARQARLRADIVAGIGEQHWDLVWTSRARTHVITDGLVAGTRIVDFDDLTDRLLRSEIRDRVSRHGFVRTLPRNAFNLVESRRWTRLQRRVLADAACVVVCNADDQQYLAAPNVAVVPNGYPRPTRDVTTVKYDVPTLFFVGPLSYEPNRLAVDWLAFEVLPRIREQLPEARLLVAGYNHGVGERLRRAPGVTLLGYVHDLAPYYVASSVAVTPIRSGGGTRLKVIEALARQLPLVSTSFGCAGLGLVAGRDLLVADDPDDFAAACLRVISDPVLASRLTAAGFVHYRQHLTAAAASRAVAAAASAAMDSSKIAGAEVPFLAERTA